VTEGRRWTIAQEAGWLRIDDAKSISCVEACLVEVFGTTSGGFVVMTSSDRLYFECKPDHARECVNLLFNMLAVQ
jgi:hypothetical protein